MKRRAYDLADGYALAHALFYEFSQAPIAPTPS
jgi:hypothetical protein